MAPHWSEAGPLPPGLPVEIEYARVGGEVFVYRQHLVDASSAAIVTLQTSTPLSRPKRVKGRAVLEPGSPVVWFTFEDRWHDIGAFHLADGTFTGWYANVLTPVELGATVETGWRWRTTDLCLDVWRDDRGASVLDADELLEAEAEGRLAADTAARARAEAELLLADARNHEWPPALVGEWPLEAARRRAGH